MTDSITVWLVGQSLGGIVAQIIIKNYPESIDGLVLSNTCSLSKNMNIEAYDHLMKIIENQKKAKKCCLLFNFLCIKSL